jgi:hypothetical protein
MFIDGFEEFSGSGTPNPLLQTAEWVVDGTMTVVAGRSSATGSAALGGDRVSMARGFPWVSDTFSCGAAFKFADRGALMRLTVGTAAIQLWLNEINGVPMVNAQQGGALPTKNRWYYYELKLNRAAATCELWINNKKDSEFALPAGAAAAETVVVKLGYQDSATYRPPEMPAHPDNGVKFFDDFYARDGERLGPIIVTTRFPTADVTAQWFKAGAELTHAATVSMHPPEPLDTYVAGDTIGKEDRFTSNVQLPNENPVLATGILFMARKAPTLNAALGVFMGGNSGAIAARTGKRSVEADWRTQYVVFEPVVGDTPTGVEVSEFGINIATP